MKRILSKIIIGIIILSFLTGCGIFNLGNFTIPDDLEFIAVIESLDTPQAISDYMMDNFTYELHGWYAPSPYILWQTKKGDCNDFSTFGTFIANYHGYETYQIRIEGIGYVHYLGVYVEDMYSFTDNRKYYYGFETFREMVDKSSKRIGKAWKSYKVYDYDRNIVEKGTNE